MRRSFKTKDNRLFSAYAKDKATFDFCVNQCMHGLKTPLHDLRHMSKITNADKARARIGYPGNRYVTYTLKKISAK